MALRAIKMEISAGFPQLQDSIKLNRRYEGWYYIQFYSYYIILYFESDWSRIRPLPSTTLKISPNHLEKLEVKFASEVQIGDALITANGDKSRVVDINYMMRRGVFAPVTHSGMIIVMVSLFLVMPVFPTISWLT